MHTQQQTLPKQTRSKGTSVVGSKNGNEEDEEARVSRQTRPQQKNVWGPTKRPSHAASVSLPKEGWAGVSALALLPCSPRPSLRHHSLRCSSRHRLPQSRRWRRSCPSCTHGGSVARRQRRGRRLRLRPRPCLHPQPAASSAQPAVPPTAPAAWEPVPRRSALAGNPRGPSWRRRRRVRRWRPPPSCGVAAAVAVAEEEVALRRRRVAAPAPARAPRVRRRAPCGTGRRCASSRRRCARCGSSAAAAWPPSAPASTQARRGRAGVGAQVPPQAQRPQRWERQQAPAAASRVPPAAGRLLPLAASTALPLPGCRLRRRRRRRRRRQ
eukprot:Rhum_TRINITY_DN14121_c9_g1::Rhum_TRINITY_DN14121_c9_g1_i1::g.71345::m.71345